MFQSSELELENGFDESQVKAEVKQTVTTTLSDMICSEFKGLINWDTITGVST